MAYADIAALHTDQDFARRVIACAATQQIEQPDSWALANLWAMAAQPGFGDAYASALAADIERPGRDPAVISDAQILAAVQSITGGPS